MYKMSISIIFSVHYVGSNGNKASFFLSLSSLSLSHIELLELVFGVYISLSSLALSNSLVVCFMECVVVWETTRARAAAAARPVRAGHGLWAFFTFLGDFCFGLTDSFVYAN